MSETMDGDRYIAYHEAGHAVVCLALGHDVEYVSIAPTEEERLSDPAAVGSTFCPDCPGEGEFPHHDPAQAKRLLGRLLAGAIATRIQLGDYRWSLANRDLAAIARLFTREMPLAGLDALRAKGLRSTTIIPFQPGVLELIMGAGLDTMAWLRSPEVWSRVEAVAESLLEEKRLNNAQLRDLCAHMPPLE